MFVSCSRSHHMAQKQSDSAGITRSQLLAEHATLSFLIYRAYWTSFKRQLKIEHSLGDGLYCTDLDGAKPITQEMCDQLTSVIRRILDSDTPIEFPKVKRDFLLDIFAQTGQNDKVGILKSWQDEYITCIKCGEFLDYMIEPCSSDKERLKIFEIRPYADGLVIRYPTWWSPRAVGKFDDPQVLHDMFKEYSEWAKLIKCEYVASLNDIIYKRKIDDIKWVAEGLHEQKFAQIADKLAAGFPAKRIVTIAGPSSSNKTTFAKRLAISLRVLGFTSVVVEMDDYFRDNKEIPFGPDGLQDFEHISALNVELLGERIKKLTAGEKIPVRRFLFKKGIGVDQSESLELPKNAFLILEGIHGLNPILLDALGGKDKVCPIYVSALTPVNIDCNHRFPTSSLRLIRRMVRDYRFRGHSPRDTLMRWASVRKGEERNIFPYQANAELFFNSALVYELPVLAIFGKGLLAEASMPGPNEDPNSPRAEELTKEALRLQGLLNYFYPVSVEHVPHISCIREFVGGSDLKY